MSSSIWIRRMLFEIGGCASLPAPCCPEVSLFVDWGPILGLKTVAISFLVRCNYHVCLAANARLPEPRGERCGCCRRDSLFSMETWFAVWSASEEDLSSMARGTARSNKGSLSFSTAGLFQAGKFRRRYSRDFGFGDRKKIEFGPSTVRRAK